MGMIDEKSGGKPRSHYDTMMQIEEAERIVRLFFRMAFWTVLLILLVVLIVKVADAEEYTCVVRKGEYVWIRESPSPDGRKIGRCRFGFEVSSDQAEGNFIRIGTRQGWMLEGESSSSGWVDRSYFERPVPEKMYRVNTKEGPLAKRETPDGRLLCWIKPGVRISVLGWRYSKSGELWAKVFRGGYCKAEYLELR